VYKEHPGHPKTSQLVYSAIQKALQTCGLPEAVFQHVSGGIEAGQELVKHPKTKAIAFTGSYKGGKAIFDLACQREQPVPVYAEMGSVNPIFVLPEKAETEGSQLAEQVAQSVLLGVGQFCTCPGLVFYPETGSTTLFLDRLSVKLEEAAGDKMLHEGICENYYRGLHKLRANRGIEALVTPDEDVLTGKAALAKTSVKEWLQNPEVQEEVFGPFTMVVTYSGLEELEQAAAQLQGQLTCTLWGSDTEILLAETLVDAIWEKCGRLLFEGVPTGVEVSHAMTHGGPFPATTDSRSTSVGAYAIKRFARPVTFQAAPQALLPDELKDTNPLSIWRTINGHLTMESI
jgi:NADP-dependent aldehyde dehydrogenase